MTGLAGCTCLLRRRGARLRERVERRPRWRRPAAGGCSAAGPRRQPPRSSAVPQFAGCWNAGGAAASRDAAVLPRACSSASRRCDRTATRWARPRRAARPVAADRAQDDVERLLLGDVAQFQRQRPAGDALDVHDRVCPTRAHSARICANGRVRGRQRDLSVLQLDDARRPSSARPAARQRSARGNVQRSHGNSIRRLRAPSDASGHGATARGSTR